ncbi:CPBP family intramembrane glutamic endopeptidase [Dysosmobacter sp.]|uniref:CPBP family intramembrane glutamic endopeptidase n=1 Tax=Dysosmobacter sp. TaxID=2591382 RepID=UPI002A8DEE5F|nr:CPBP family intramembrane glutamic endopeptidase [Dysosmobacter sp.]MDY3280791.1 CPBP family intramembrane glutamic endopeptidase [Dysosmobacter sp.]
MAKKKSGGEYLTPGEQIAGTVLLALYLLVLPAVREPLFDLAERLTGANLSPALRSAVYYYALLAAVAVIFHRFLSRTSRNFADNLGVACEAALTGLVALYGLNELVCRLGRLLVGGLANLNDTLIAAPVPDAPRTTFLIAVLVVPIAEETLFRGLVFGGLRGKSRWIAYAASCCLFALSQVWQLASAGLSPLALARLLQYLVPGAVLCRTYERSGSLWSAAAVHAAANALCLWTG